MAKKGGRAEEAAVSAIAMLSDGTSTGILNDSWVVQQRGMSRGQIPNRRKRRTLWQ